MMGDPFSAVMPTNSLAASVQWLAAVMTGSVAMAIAVIAVAAMGLAMMSGRINLRGSAATILGCFVVFGAPSLAHAFLALAATVPEGPPPAERSPEPATYPLQQSGVSKSDDPYAGAAMPVQ